MARKLLFKTWVVGGIFAVCSLIFGITFFPTLKKASQKQEFLKEYTLDDYLTAVDEYPIYLNPSYELIEDFKLENKDSVLIFSYGSLMDELSASKDLSFESMDKRDAAVAFGIKRLFDRDVSVDDFKDWGSPIEEKSRAMLNVKYSFDYKDRVNGYAHEVKLSDLPKLIEREKGYDLIPVVVMDYNNYSKSKKGEFKIAYTFRAQQRTKLVNKEIDPRPQYYEIVRDSAKGVSPDFYNMWFETTYLSDGKTSVEKWEQALIKKEAKTQVQT